jgi:hybrid cluster-associated redox disulfide protein
MLMDRTLRWFIIMSLVYFLAASFLGLGLSMNMGGAGVRFAHIHLNLLGFMAMMIYGVGYFILPRFNARTLRWSRMVDVHFWLANAGLVGMVLTYPLASAPGPALFVLFAAASVISVALFVINIVATMLAKQPAAEVKAVPAAKAPLEEEAEPITGGMKVADILERYPQAREVLVAAGLLGISEPEGLERLRRVGITLEMACRRHGLNPEELIAKIQGKGAKALPPSIRPQLCTRDAIIGDVLKAYPQTQAVFRKYYGDGCFSCPGQAFETIAQSALIHNVNESEILEALNKAIGAGKAS